MFGRQANQHFEPFASLFNDPFFRDPFGHMADPTARFTQPQIPNSQHTTHRAPVIEEVPDYAQEGGHMVNREEPVVEEPDDDDPAAHRSSQRQRTTYQQPNSNPPPSQHHAHHHPDPAMSNHQLSTFGPSLFGGSIFDSFFGNALSSMQQMHQHMAPMTNQPGVASYSYSSSTVTHSGPNGITYSKSHTTRAGPGGVRETQSTIHDGRTGERSMTISRALGDKERTVTRVRDATGQEKKDEVLRGLNTDEADRFDTEWVQEAERKLHNIGGSSIQRSSHPSRAPLQLQGPSHVPIQRSSSIQHPAPVPRTPMEASGSGISHPSRTAPLTSSSSLRGRDRSAAVTSSAPRTPAVAPSNVPYRGGASMPSGAPHSSYSYPSAGAGVGYSNVGGAGAGAGTGYGGASVPGTTRSPSITNMYTQHQASGGYTDAGMGRVGNQYQAGGRYA